MNGGQEEEIPPVSERATGSQEEKGEDRTKKVRLDDNIEQHEEPDQELEGPHAGVADGDAGMGVEVESEDHAAGKRKRDPGDDGNMGAGHRQGRKHPRWDAISDK